jgi:hypothetical protein
MQDTHQQLLTVVLHSSIPLLSKRLGIWSQNAAKADLQVVKVCCLGWGTRAHSQHRRGNSLARKGRRSKLPRSLCLPPPSSAYRMAQQFF